MKNKPITFLDLETTGTDVNESLIVDITMISIGYGKKTKRFSSKINPGISIPPAASQVHGIYDKDLEESPTLLQVLPQIVKLLEGCDIGGYNSDKFDVPLLYNELYRCGYVWDIGNTNFIDVMKIFFKKESRDLTAAVKFYLNSDHKGAHGSESDVIATMNVFKQQLLTYDLPGSNADLMRFCNDGKPLLDLGRCFTMDVTERVVFTFGKHKDLPIKDHMDYLDWMLTGKFHSHTKEFIINFQKKIQNRK